MRIGFLRKYNENWYLVPEEQMQEWEAYMSILAETSSNDWYLFADRFEKEYRRYLLIHDLENLRILLEV